MTKRTGNSKITENSKKKTKHFKSINGIRANIKSFLNRTDIFILPVLAGFLIALVLKLFFVDFLTISGSSMEPALKSGQKVIINKFAYGLKKPYSDTFFFQWNTPKKNEVVVFLHDNKIVVKRCVLTQGDKLEFLLNSEYDVTYSLRIGGQTVPISKTDYEKFGSCRFVPQGYVFVLGDNYNASLDSRSYGFVSVKNITGRVVGNEQLFL